MSRINQFIKKENKFVIIIEMLKIEIKEIEIWLFNALIDPIIIMVIITSWSSSSL